MHKHAILWVLLGWVVSLVLPPQSLLGMFRGVTGAA